MSAMPMPAVFVPWMTLVRIVLLLATAVLGVRSVHHRHRAGDAAICHSPVTAVPLLLMFMFLRLVLLVLASLLPTLFVVATRHGVCP